MAIKSRQELKVFFETNKRPTEEQFHDLIDSYVHNTEDDYVNTNELNQAIIDQTPDLAPVQSVNGLVGNVVINIPQPPVLSVNGFTGEVNIPIPVLDDSGWQNINSFSNGVLNYNIDSAVKIRKKNGIVYITGSVKSGLTQTNGLTYLLFTLPLGYRPIRKLSFGVVRANTSLTTYVIGRIDIDSDGKVFGVNYSNLWTNLSDISFLID